MAQPSSSESVNSNLPLIVDGHNDTLLRLYLPKEGEERTFFERSEVGHIDLPRAQEGGLGGGFFAIFAPNPHKAEHKNPFPGENVDGEAGYETPLPPALEWSYAARTAMGMMSLLYRLEVEAEGNLTIVKSAAQMQQALDEQVLGVILHFEGAEAIDEDLETLPVYYRAGLRSLGLTWSRPNLFAQGVPFAFPADPDIGTGLTEAGKRLVRACNQMGILIDLSHLNEAGFWDVERISDAPLVATHASAHALSATARNLTDAQIDAVGNSGGVIGVNFHVGFLREDGRADLPTSLEKIVDHVDYIVDRIGIEHVALGSDFDGATMPSDLVDVTGLPRLLSELQKRGYDDDALIRIAHANWIRVLKATWKG